MDGVYCRLMASALADAVRLRAPHYHETFPVSLVGCLHRWGNGCGLWARRRKPGGRQLDVRRSTIYRRGKYFAGVSVSERGRQLRRRAGVEQHVFAVAFFRRDSKRARSAGSQGRLPTDERERPEDGPPGESCPATAGPTITGPTSIHPRNQGGRNRIHRKIWRHWHRQHHHRRQSR